MYNLGIFYAVTGILSLIYPLRMQLRGLLLSKFWKKSIIAVFIMVPTIE